MRSHAKAIVAVSAMLLLTLVLAANPASAEAPTVSIDPPSEVAYTTAKAAGTVDPKDIGSWWSYETSTDGGATWSGFGYHGYAEAGTGSQPTPYELTGLLPGTAYELRLVANNSTDPEVISTLESFTTLAVAKPTVILEPVSGIGGEEASFQGEIDSNAPDANENLSDAAKAAFATTYRFECTPGCPNTPGNQTIAADDEPQSVSFDAENLEPDTQYTVKLFAFNAGGVEVAERSFETNALAPTVAAGTVGALSHNSARLTAYVDANNAATTATFEYATQADFSDATVAPSGAGTTITGNGNKVAYADLSGLTAEQDYFWRVSVESAEGADDDTAPRAFAPFAPPFEGECPNEAIRKAQGSTYLARCRAYELVSNPQKTVPVVAGEVSPDGQQALYRVYGGTGQTSYGVSPVLLTRRTASGWQSSSPVPPRERLERREGYLFSASSDWRRFLILTGAGYFPATENDRSLYRYDSDSGAVERLYTFDRPFTELRYTSNDLRHVIVAPGMPLLSEDTAPRGGMYDVGSGEPELLSLLPNGDVASCGVSTEQSELPNQYGGGVRLHLVSEDGSRVYFHTRGSGACSGSAELYMREGGGAGVTHLVSGPRAEGTSKGARFISATPDGSQAFYTTQTRIAEEDENESNDLYRYTVGVGSDCLTCSVAEAAVDNEGPPPGGGEGSGVMVAENGGRAYFTSDKRLAPGAPSGKSLYVWRAEEPERIGFVAPISGLGLTGANGALAAATFDGSTLVFRSGEGRLDAATGSESGGTDQYYRYDDRSGELACLSCAGESGPSLGVGGFPGSPLSLTTPRVVSGDGETVLFRTSSPLVARDDNGIVDIYEWHQGRQALVSDGRQPLNTQVPHLAAGMSEDGGALGLVTFTELLPEAKGSHASLYVARINGGFSPPVPPAPCGGDGCQGAPTAPPATENSGTASFSGAGNPKKPPRARCSKGKTKRKGRCVKKQPRERSTTAKRGGRR